MNGRYILNANGEPEPCADLMAWATSREGSRRVALTTVGDVEVSTVFLGLDHSFGSGPPVLFETMVFGGEHDQHQDRYCTRAEAVEGHLRVCAMVWPA